MESKSRNLYDCVLQYIKNNLLPTLNPDKIITDYGSALRDTMLSTFPGAQSSSLWYYHNQVRKQAYYFIIYL